MLNELRRERWIITGIANRPVKLERIRAVAVGGLLLQVCGKVDDSDGLKGAFLHERKSGSEMATQKMSGNRTLTLTQIPQPMQSSSERKAILSVGDTSIHSLPEYGYERS